MSLPEETPPQVRDAAADPAQRHLQPVSDPDTDGTAADGTAADPAPAASAAVPSAWLAWLSAAFAPQSGLYSTRAAAPREVVHRARHGQQLADAGPLRHAAHAYGYWQAAGKVATRTVEWLLFDHPARTLLMAVFGLLTWLLLAT